MIPGGQAVAAAAPLVAGILRGLGISRVSANAMAQRKKGGGAKGRGGRRRAAKRNRGNKANLAPRTALTQKGSMPAQLGAGVPSTYQSSKAIPNRKDGERVTACEGLNFTVTLGAGPGAVFATALQTLTPSNTTLFPWLSDLADIYTKFFFRKLRLHFVSSMGTTSAFTAFLAYSPDVEMDASLDFAGVMAMAQKNVGPVWQSLSLGVNLAEEGEEPYYIDTDGSDDRLENQGILFFGENGATGTGAAATYGQLFVEYEVDLYDRKGSALTLAAREMRTALMNRSLPPELRRQCGFAMVEEILRARPTREKKESKLVVARRKAEQLLPPPTGRGPFAPGYPSTTN